DGRPRPERETRHRPEPSGVLHPGAGAPRRKFAAVLRAPAVHHGPRRVYFGCRLLYGVLPERALRPARRTPMFEPQREVHDELGLLRSAHEVHRGILRAVPPVTGSP